MTVTDGAQALDRLTENNFNLVLIDIKIPTLSGYDLLRLMREKLNHHTKMLYVSIVPEADVTMDNSDGFIQKLFSQETLLASVKEALGE